MNHQNFFRKIVNGWKVSHPLPEKAEVVIALSYSATANGLTQKSREVWDKALVTTKNYPDASLAFAVSKFCHTKGVEESYKMKTLPSQIKFIFADEAVDTISEAREIKKLLDKIPSSIILVCDECHSRRALAVWQKEFRASNIFVESVLTNEITDHESPQILLRDKWVWLLVNMLGFMVTKIFGNNLIQKVGVRQPIT